MRRRTGSAKIRIHYTGSVLGSSAKQLAARKGATRPFSKKNRGGGGLSVNGARASARSRGRGASGNNHNNNSTGTGNRNVNGNGNASDDSDAETMREVRALLSKRTFEHQKPGQARRLIPSQPFVENQVR